MTEPTTKSGMSTAAKWAIGLGTGCLVLVIAIVVPAVVVFWFMRAEIAKIAEAPGGSNTPHALTSEAGKADPILRSFIILKRRQASTLAKKFEDTIPSEVTEFFNEAEHGNWARASKLYEKLLAWSGRAGGAAKPTFPPYLWEPIVESSGAHDQFSEWDRKLLRQYGDGILQSLPDNSIYFGGTDPGRFIITALRDVADKPSVFVVTQNQLAVNSYLVYLRTLYGDRIHIPSDEDSAAAIRSYVQELQHRPALPGEQLSVVDGRVQIRGLKAVTALNGLISKLLFDNERDKHPFYVEESFAIDWMYNYLEPCGLIMKLNRDPLPKITPNTASLDHKFWTDYIDTNLKHNPAFGRNAAAQRSFSKLREAHASLYAWRVTMAPSEQRQPELAGEAEFAFRQSLELCPFNPEAVGRFAEFLTRTDRYDDALALVKNYKKYDPKNTYAGGMLIHINDIRREVASKVAPPSSNK